jgi:hypothetical protein
MGEQPRKASGLMFSGKHAAWFFVQFLFVFVILMAPLPGLARAYGACFRAGCNVLFARFGSDGSVRCRPSVSGGPENDLACTLVNRRTGAEYTFAGGSRLQGYKPTAFILALTLATPIPWRRRIRAVLWASLLVNVYVAVRMAVFLLVAFSGDNSLALFTPGPFWKGVLTYLNWVVVVSYAGWLVLPLLIWLVVVCACRQWRPAPAQRTGG